MPIFNPRPFARMLMPSMVREGLNRTTIRNRLRAMGFGYRNTEMLRDIREFQGFLGKEGLFRDFPPDLLPTPDLMTEIDLTRPAYKYRVFGRVEKVNVLSGRSITQTVSFYTNDLKSMEDMAEEYIDLLETETLNESQILHTEELESFQFIGIEHNAGYPY